MNKWNAVWKSSCIISRVLRTSYPDRGLGSREGLDCDDAIRKTRLMTTANSKDHAHFDLAFELAYCIHVNKEVAFFVAEDALDGLPLMLGNQERHRKPSERLRGFWKGGERTRPIRKTIKLNERQMLQWLVYKHSESWERQTERGEGLYLPTEEDMIVRYLEHLVFITLRRGSFYVTLAVGQLLHQFDRRETRLFYDILTQSDSARMKDMGYIGKQRLELLERICRRFDEIIQTVKTASGEKHLVMRPATPEVIHLVHKSLRRFAPWDTACIVKSGFDITDIPGLYFSGDGGDEDLIEMDRIHTLLDPECFARFIEGLSKYVRTLPGNNQDKGCNYDSPNERLAVPQFASFSSGSSRGDRFQSPELTAEDYIRLQRTLDARTRRRKSFTPQQLCVYVDNVLSQSFDPKRKDPSQFVIGPEAGVIEVRGRDAEGELTLAIVIVDYDQIPVGGALRDLVVHQGGQKVEIQLTPIRDAEGEVEGGQLEVTYAERAWLGLTGLMRRNRDVSENPRPNYAWLMKAGVAVALIVAALILIWFQLRPSREEVSTPQQAEQPATEEEKPVSPAIPSAPPEQLPASAAAPLIASATWSKNPQTALRAIPIEPTRGEVKTIDLSRRQTQILLNLPQYADSAKYSRYRITIVAANEKLWQQTLRAPAVSLTGNAHILNLTLFPQRMPSNTQYELRVDGQTQSGWQRLGHVLLNPIGR